MIEVTVWTPWIGGLIIGLYIVVQQWTTNKALGCSTPLANACSITSKAKFFEKNSYKSDAGSRNLWFLVGIFIGGLVAAILSNGTWYFDVTMSMGTHYDTYLPDALWLKAIVITVGGVMLGFGARLAGGCTSGHSMAGVSMLNPVSMLATALFFIGGILVVNIMNYFSPVIG